MADESDRIFKGMIIVIGNYRHRLNDPVSVEPTLGAIILSEQAHQRDQKASCIKKIL